MEKKPVITPENEAQATLEQPGVLEEIVVEELSIDGVCGVY